MKIFYIDWLVQIKFHKGWKVWKIKEGPFPWPHDEDKNSMMGLVPAQQFVTDWVKP